MPRPCRVLNWFNVKFNLSLYRAFLQLCQCLYVIGLFPARLNYDGDLHLIPNFGSQKSIFLAS